MTPDPFHPICKSPFYFETAGAADALRRLEDGFGSREPFLLLTGEPGTGKTTFANAAIARWESRVMAAFLAGPVLSGAELLEEIVMRWGGQPPDGASRPKLVGCFERELARIAGQGKIPMVVVDDAQNLTPGLLEELRLLVNAAQRVQQPMEVLLIGLPGLESLFDNPALAALRQRVSVRAKIEPLTVAETRRYLRHRAGAVGRDGANMFPRKICVEIASMTDGVPRRINTLASEALRLAMIDKEAAVHARHLRAAMEALSGATSVRADHQADVDPEDSEPAEAPQNAEREARRAAPEPPRATKSSKGSRAPERAQAAPAKTPAPERTQGPAPKRAQVPASPREQAPAPARDQAPAPGREPAPAPSRERTPAPTRTSAPAPVPASPPAQTGSPFNSAAEFADPPLRVVPTTHDPNEWVARFIGDQGPVRIGAQVLAMSNWPEDLDDPVKPESSAKPTSAPSGPVLGSRPPRRTGSSSRFTAVAAAAVLAVTAVVFLIRNGSSLRKPSERVASVERPSRTEGPSAMAAAPATATASAVEERSTSIDSTQSSAASTAPRDTVRSSGAVISPTGRYTLDVGGFRELDRAFDERERIVALTGIEAWVIPAPEGSDEPHRIVVGKFSSAERAAAAAKTFLATQTFDHVDVVPLPRRSARQ